LRVIKSDNLKSNEIPDNAFKALARCLYPAILAYFESESGKHEFAEWQKRKVSLSETLASGNLPGMNIKSENIRRAG